MSEEPNQIGDNRQPDGTFGPGNIANPNGRPKGSLSLIELLKKELEKVPEGQKLSYAEAFIKKVLHKAINEGDQQSQRLVMNYVEGLPTQALKVQGQIDHILYLPGVLIEKRGLSQITETNSE